MAAACGRSGDGAQVAGESIVAEPTTTTTLAPETTTTTRLTYVVQSGDTLSVIADRFGVGTRQLADFNAISDINAIAVGQELAIPPSTASSEGNPPDTGTSGSAGGGTSETTTTP